jgi:hypothetical protein
MLSVQFQTPDQTQPQPAPFSANVVVNVTEPVNGNLNPDLVTGTLTITNDATGVQQGQPIGQTSSVSDEDGGVILTFAVPALTNNTVYILSVSADLAPGGGEPGDNGGGVINGLYQTP